MRWLAALAAVAVLAACHGGDDARRSPAAREFPRPTRPIAPEGPAATAQGDAQSGAQSEAQSEARRDAGGEADWVMRLAGVGPGMRVADIGAGEGYYTVRMSPIVGRRGRVLAEDIDGQALSRLGDRVQRQRLDNVSIQLGDAVDPHLPPASFDRVLLVHVYNQVREPYAFLWHLRGGLRRGGSVVVVEDDAPNDRFAIAPGQLFCEFSQLGFRLIQFATKSGSTGYYAQFEAIGDRPEPATVKPCANSAVFSAGRG